MFKRLLKNKIFLTCFWIVLILAIWETVCRLGMISRFLLPPFSEVIVNMLNEFVSGNLRAQTINSLLIILWGFGIALVLSVIITLLCSWSSIIESLFTTLATIFNPLPAIALMPLIILWFGIKEGAMLVIIVHAVLWAMVRHLLDGLRSIPKVYYEWSDNIELSPLRKFTGVLFFAILPELIAGIRVGWGRAWRALIGAEMIFGMIGSLGGIGYYIYNARVYAKVANVMSGVIVIVVIGIVIESLLFNKLEKITIKKWGMIRE